MQIDAVALGRRKQLEAIVGQAFGCMRAPTPSSSSRSTRHLLEHAGTDAAEHVVGAALFDDHVVDARLAQQGRPSSKPDGPAPTMTTWVRRCDGVRVVDGGSIPWRRFASAAAGEAMKSSSACAASGCRARTPTAAEKVVTIWIDAGSGPSTSMPST